MARRREAKARGGSRERVGKKLGEAIFEKLKSRKLEMPQIFEEDKKNRRLQGSSTTGLKSWGRNYITNHAEDH